MRVIARKMLERFGQRHPQALAPLFRWHAAVAEAEWTDFTQARAAFPHADQVHAGRGRTVAVFNVGGNKFRVVTAIHCNRQIVCVMRVYTHKDYDAIDWKVQL
jgi:mRNA interferase HigB